MLVGILKNNLNVEVCVVFYHVCVGFEPCNCSCRHQGESLPIPVCFFRPEARPRERTVVYQVSETSGSASERL